MILQQISEKVLAGQAPAVESLVNEAMEQGLSALEVLNNGLLKGMGELGERWKRNQVFVPQVLIGARAMSAGTALIEKVLLEEGVEPRGKVIIGTVKGDLHDIGKNLVGMMIKGAGFDVIDLGVDVSAEQYVQGAEEHGTNIVAVSALLTTTMPYIKTVVEEFEKRGLRDKYIIMAGGAPVTETFVNEVGADYYTEDAVSAAEKVKELFPA